jgi:hypothetical protein
MCSRLRAIWVNGNEVERGTNVVFIGLTVRQGVRHLEICTNLYVHNTASISW